MKFSLHRKILLVPAMIFAAGTLASCTSAEDPEDPGFNKPAVTGVLKGEITTWEDYGDALEKENNRANRDGPRWNDGFREDF
ncbi:MAG: hypothetical protein E7037_00690 [Verrucomicrobia bacterium]|nr:hypothetical protein [Verrucomicrobiota bacterium]